VEYYDQLILTRIGHRLGRTIRNDDSTASSTGAKFARISEEIDLNKPMCSKFRMKRKIWKVEYESLHLVCFHCRKYGHRKESCSDLQEGNNLDAMDESSPPLVPVADPTPVIRPEIVEQFGSWMLCKGTEKEGGNPCLRISSSRFGILEKISLDKMLMDWNIMLIFLCLSRILLLLLISLTISGMETPQLKANLSVLGRSMKVLLFLMLDLKGILLLMDLVMPSLDQNHVE